MEKEQTKKEEYPAWIKRMSRYDTFRKYNNKIDNLILEVERETNYKIVNTFGTFYYLEKGDANTTKKIEAKDTKELAKKIFDLKNKGE